MLQVVAAGILLVGVLVLVTAQDWRAGLVFAAFSVLALVVLRHSRDHAVPARPRHREASAELFGSIEERLAGLEDVRANGGGQHAMRRFHEVSAGAVPRPGPRRVARRRGRHAELRDVRGGNGARAAHRRLALRRRPDLDRHRVPAVPVDPARARIARGDRRPVAHAAAGGRGRDARRRAVRPAAVDRRRHPRGAAARARSRSSSTHVSFSYGDGPLALDDVSFSLPAGRVLGVVGRTGSGKSTLARLLLRLYDATDGSVRVDGVDVRDLTLHGLRSAVGIVTQDVQLFEATLRDNLTLFAEHADDARLVSVLEELDLGSWLARLPDGLDTLIGGEGVGLSAGEAQLLAFGRVFLRDPGPRDPRRGVEPARPRHRAAHRAGRRPAARRTHRDPRRAPARDAGARRRRARARPRSRRRARCAHRADGRRRRRTSPGSSSSACGERVVRLWRMGWRLWRSRPGLATAGTLAWIAFHTMPFFVGHRAPRDLRRAVRLRARGAQRLQPHRDPRGDRSRALVDLLRRVGVVAPRVGVDERAAAGEHARRARCSTRDRRRNDCRGRPAKR